MKGMRGNMVKRVGVWSRACDSEHVCVCISVYKCVQYASDSLRELTAVCNQQAGSGAWCESYVFQHTSEAEAQGQIKVVPHDLSLLFLPRTSARFI